MRRLRPRLTFANVVSMLALCVAVGGGVTAVAGSLPGRNTVGSGDIKPKAVKTSDLGGNAATGAKVKESSFRIVPNADRLDGRDGSSYQLGDGVDDAAAAFVDSGDEVSFPFADGTFDFTCGNPSSLMFTDFAGDPFTTDIWREGDPHPTTSTSDAHDEVADGGTQSYGAIGSEGSERFHVWGFLVSDVTLSHVFDSSTNPDECRVAFIVQGNFDTPGGPVPLASSSSRSDDGRKGGGGEPASPADLRR
jgi:hypothetical protein